MSLELYLRAYDDKGNEVLAWSDPTRPREIPLRYDPPQPWYRKRWVTVYQATLAPPDRVDGSAIVH